MKHSTQNQTNQQQVKDPLTELIQEGARHLIAQAVETELQLLLQQEPSTIDGKRSIIRNGYLPKRTIQTGKCAAKKWKRHKKSSHILPVLQGVKFTNGVVQQNQTISARDAA